MCACCSPRNKVSSSVAFGKLTRLVRHVWPLHVAVFKALKRCVLFRGCLFLGDSDSVCRCCGHGFDADLGAAQELADLVEIGVHFEYLTPQPPVRRVKLRDPGHQRDVCRRREVGESSFGPGVFLASKQGVVDGETPRRFSSLAYYGSRKSRDGPCGA